MSQQTQSSERRFLITLFTLQRWSSQHFATNPSNLSRSAPSRSHSTVAVISPGAHATSPQIEYPSARVNMGSTTTWTYSKNSQQPDYGQKNQSTIVPPGWWGWFLKTVGSKAIAASVD